MDVDELRAYVEELEGVIESQAEQIIMLQTQMEEERSGRWGGGGGGEGGDERRALAERVEALESELDAAVAPVQSSRERELEREVVRARVRIADLEAVVGEKADQHKDDRSLRAAAKARESGALARADALRGEKAELEARVEEMGGQLAAAQDKVSQLLLELASAKREASQAVARQSELVLMLRSNS